MNEISNAIGNLHKASHTSLSASEITDIFEILEAHIFNYGLTTDNLRKIIDLITQENTLRSADVHTIIRYYLIPRNRIPSRIVTQIVSSFASSNPASIRTKERLARWLVISHRFFEDEKILSKLYGVLFMNLKYETLRPWICHLLFLSTSSIMVKPWRIQYIVELYRKNRESIQIAGLLMLYREYAPHLIVDRFPVINGAIFKPPDPDLEAKIAELHDDLAQSDELNETRLSSRNTKRRKLEIPVVQSDMNHMKMGIEDVTSLSEFAQKIHTLDFPLQMGSLLHDSGFAVRLLIYKDDEIAWERLNNWLCTILFAELNDSDNLFYLLKQVEKFTRYTKILPIGVEEFLYHYLTKWDGQGRIKSVLFSLITFLPLMSQKILADNLLTPLLEHLPEHNVEWRLDALNSLTGMLFNWEIMYGAAFKQQLSVIEGMELSEADLTVRYLIELVNEFGMELMQESNDDITVQHTILTFYETLVQTSFANHLSTIGLFSFITAEYIIFGWSLTNFSRMCGIIARYREIYSDGHEQDPNIQKFTSFSTDLRNLLWGSGSFPPFSLEPEFINDIYDLCERRNQPLNSLFTVTNSPLFIWSNTKYMRSLEDKEIAVERHHQGPVTEDSLEKLKKTGGIEISYDEYRKAFVKYLRDEGLIGIYEFLDIEGMSSF